MTGLHALRRKTAVAGAALAVGLVIPLATAGAASADSSAGPDVVNCIPELNTNQQVTNSNYHFGVGPIFKNGPGGTISGANSVTATVGTTFAVSAGASAGITAGVLTTSAKAEISASITGSVAVGTTMTYTHQITAGKYGNMQFGVWGFAATWQRVQLYSNCTTKTVASGTAKYPKPTIGWYYWET